LIVAIINFSSLIISFFIMGYTYIISIQPMKRAEKRGDKAWKECKTFRSVGGIFELISVINLILWIWYPLPLLGEWRISSNIWVGLIIGLCMLVPCLILVGKGVIDAGSETLSPSKETEMYGGIYNHIRHPQSLGEFPLFVALGFMLNSWFFVLISLIFIIVYIPIMIHFEEKDLVRRFGDKYKEYQEHTGALFPKLRKNISH
jgi:protein-S-isoprenylcysteine O-methyltransferase Ste14